MSFTWRLPAVLLGAAALSTGGIVAANAQDTIKIGYALPLTGPNSGGANVTLLPLYKMWVEKINAAGGLTVGGKKMKMEAISYDDRSNAEEVVRAVERLINQDKVNFVLQPFGTGFNLAVAPILARAGYPHLGTTAITDRAPELAKRWPSSFWMTGMSSQYGSELTKVLGPLKNAGQLNNKVAMVAIADGFGIDMSAAARPAFKAAGFDLVYDKTYPIGTQDMAPIINEAKATGADSFIGFSYPPDTIQLTQQAITSSFNPKVFYLGALTSTPVYRNRFKENAEGVLSFGGYPDLPKVREFVEEVKATQKTEPDYATGGLMTWVSLEMLQQAIERKGLDRAAVTEELRTGTFDTIIGKFKLVDNMPQQLPLVGQWQGGTFYPLGPVDYPGARKLTMKPAWKQ